jgi:hypothetical protein
MKTKLITPRGMNCAICIAFLWEKTGVMGAGHRKENAINTAVLFVYSLEREVLF